MWGQIHQGFSRFSALHRSCPVSLGVDGWGIDFGLLDAGGRLLSNPVHYRDRRTEGVPERLFDLIDEKTLFSETGVQTWRINTLFQLYSMVLAGDAQLKLANTLLTIPDLFSYFPVWSDDGLNTPRLPQRKCSLPIRGLGDAVVLRKVGIPGRDSTGSFSAKRPARPCSPRNTLASAASRLTVQVIAVASHDTASAVAAIPEMDTDSAFISSGTWSLMGTEIPAPEHFGRDPSPRVHE